MDDNSLMLFGEHKGKPLAEVPAHYLLWVGKQEWCRGELLTYINDNAKALELEAKNS